MFGKSKKKKKTAPGDKVFNDRPRKIFRHYIGKSEVLFGIFFIFFTAAMGAWFFLQKDNYDPNDRDISMEVLLAQQVEDHLWEPPLQLWVEPGSQPAAAGGAPVIDLAIYPASTVSDGWAPIALLEKFDNTNLYEKINGAETQYKEYGFQYLYFVALANSAETLEVNIELYDMGDFKNALGIFAAQRSAGSKVEARDGAYFYLTTIGALGIVDKYYFKFTGDTESEKIQQHSMRVMADFAAAQQGASVSMPKAFGLLVDGMGVEFGNIEYRPTDVFQYAFAMDFWFGRKSSEGNEAYFVHEAASAEDAAKLVAQIIDEHQWDYTVVSSENGRTVFQHNFLKTYFSIEQREAFVLGIDQAPDTAEASNALEALAAKLFENIA